MSFTLCTSGAIVTKAGEDVNQTAAASGAILEQLSEDAEGYINVMTGYDWVANYASIGANWKFALSHACSCLGGAGLVDYDKASYIGLGFAEDKINLLINRADKLISRLKEDRVKEKAGVT